MRVRLNKEVVERAQAGDRDVIFWDTELRGFGLKITSKGRKVYFLYYRNKAGTQRRPAIGEHSQKLTADAARKIAKDWLYRVAGGEDPSKERQDARAEETFKSLADRYVEEYAKKHKKPRSVEEDERNLEKHILPKLGGLKISAVSRDDVEALHNSRKAHPTNANRCLALVSHIFTKAEEWKLRPDNSNPCRNVKMFKERRRERFLSAEEMARLGDTLTKMAPPSVDASALAPRFTKKKGEPAQQLTERARDEQGRFAEAPEDWRSIACIRLLLLTGARLSEILTLQWAWIDRERGLARLPDSKTGAKNLHLPPAALELLEQLPRLDGSPYVLPGDRTATSGERPPHFIGIQKAWQRIRRAAGLQDVRLHDLRHSFASVSVAHGDSLVLIGKVLGHRQASTTERYAHLAPDPIKAIADRTAERIAAALSAPVPATNLAEAGGNVVPLRRPGAPA